MLDIGYAREHFDAIEKMARDRAVTVDLDAVTGAKIIAAARRGRESSRKWRALTVKSE